MTTQNNEYIVWMTLCLSERRQSRVFVTPSAILNLSHLMNKICPNFFYSLPYAPTASKFAYLEVLELFLQNELPIY